MYVSWIRSWRRKISSAATACGTCLICSMILARGTTWQWQNYETYDMCWFRILVELILFWFIFAQSHACVCLSSVILMFCSQVMLAMGHEQTDSQLKSLLDTFNPPDAQLQPQSKPFVFVPCSRMYFLAHFDCFCAKHRCWCLQRS